MKDVQGIRRRPLLAMAALLPTAALASSFPAERRPVALIVPYPPGGSSDTFARLVAIELAKILGVPVVVDNRPGANGTIGTMGIARAQPDGHTIGFLPASVLTVNPFLYTGVQYDVTKDLAPLTLAMETPNLLVVGPGSTARNLQEFVAQARSSPDTLNVGSMGTGSSGHLNNVLFQNMAGIRIAHVPYRGAAPALNDVISGQIQGIFENVTAALPYVQQGQLRALAVTSRARIPLLPDVPTFSETVPGFEDNPWFGFFGPAGMTAEVTAALNTTIARAIDSPAVRGPMEARGATIITSTPEVLRERAERDRRKWGPIIREANITVN